MTEVVIAGIGQVPVGEHYEQTLRAMGVNALLAALKDSGGLSPQALLHWRHARSVVSHQAT